jgi:hypothetical protein
MGNLNSLASAALLCIVAAACMAADSATTKATAGAEKVTEPEKKEQAAPAQPAASECVSTCLTVDARCGSEVRRAKAECARTASTAGQDPLTQRGQYDYAYFCGFFGNPGNACGSGYYSGRCAARLQHRYGLCLDAMTSDVTAMRFDCLKAEREAQRMCRDELQECRAACEHR